MPEKKDLIVIILTVQMVFLIVVLALIKFQYTLATLLSVIGACFALGFIGIILALNFLYDPSRFHIDLRCSKCKCKMYYDGKFRCKECDYVTVLTESDTFNVKPSEKVVEFIRGEPKDVQEVAA